MNVASTAVIREIAAAEVPICACGCGGLIEFKAHHLRTPATYIHGHGRAGVTRRWLEENQGKHLCACGCGEPIELRVGHHARAKGVPKYKPGHHLERLRRARLFAAQNRTIQPGPRRIQQNVIPGFWLKVRLLRRADFRCQKCSADLMEQLTFDHILPVWEGGLGTFENMQVLCFSCHGLKSREDTRRFQDTLSEPIRVAFAEGKGEQCR